MRYIDLVTLILTLFRRKIMAKEIILEAGDSEDIILDAEAIKAIIVEAGGINARGVEEGYTLLHLAALCGSKEIVKLLLEAGADVNIVEDRSDTTALHVAVSNKDKELVTLLLNARADINIAEGIRSATALHMAAYQGKEEIVKLLLEAGAKTDGCDLTSEIFKNAEISKLITLDQLFAPGDKKEVKDMLQGLSPEEQASLSCRFKNVAKNTILELKKLKLSGQGGSEELIESLSLDEKAKDIIKDTLFLSTVVHTVVDSNPTFAHWLSSGSLMKVLSLVDLVTLNLISDSSTEEGRAIFENASILPVDLKNLIKETAESLLSRADAKVITDLIPVVEIALPLEVEMAGEAPSPLDLA